MKASQLFALAAGALLLGTSGTVSGNSSGCLAHRPKYIEGKIEVHYDAGCTGHDEPELDPVSSAPGSARGADGTYCVTVLK